jgi:hypothetical protein
MKFKKSYLNKIGIALFVNFWLSACGGKFLDINVDPNNPSEAPPSLILPSIQVAYVSAMLAEINRASASLVDQLHSPLYGRWDIRESQFNDSWNGFYANALQDLEVLINISEDDGLRAYSGSAKLQKAYIYSLLVDLWGDVPFSEALRSENPRYDNGEDIYPQLFELIDEGLSDLASADGNPLDLSLIADIIYRGNSEKWIKMGNSLKLKLLNQTRLVDPDVPNKINAIISAGNYISSNEDDFEFYFGSGIAPQNAHPEWIRDYNAASRSGYFANSFFLKMLGGSVRRPNDYNNLSPNVQYGIRDPRLRYYFFRQTLGAAEGSSDIPCEFNQIDCFFFYAGNGYLGRDRGDNSVTPADVPTATKWGVYPAGGLFDADNAKSLTVNDGTGRGVHPMITNFMVKFHMAEAALTLGTSGDPRQLLLQGMQASINKVMLFGESRDEVPIQFKPSDEDVELYINAVLQKYDAADEQGKLEIIIDQAYVANFGNGIESYNNYRRTGYPLLMPVVENNEVGTFPLRLIYVIDELGANQNAPSERRTAIPVFWDK